MSTDSAEFIYITSVVKLKPLANIIVAYCTGRDSYTADNFLKGEWNSDLGMTIVDRKIENIMFVEDRSDPMWIFMCMTNLRVNGDAAGNSPYTCLSQGHPQTNLYSEGNRCKEDSVDVSFGACSVLGWIGNTLVLGSQPKFGFPYDSNLSPKYVEARKHKCKNCKIELINDGQPKVLHAFERNDRPFLYIGETIVQELYCTYDAFYQSKGIKCGTLEQFRHYTDNKKDFGNLMDEMLIVNCRRSDLVNAMMSVERCVWRIKHLAGESEEKTTERARLKELTRFISKGFPEFERWPNAMRSWETRGLLLQQAQAVDPAHSDELQRKLWSVERINAFGTETQSPCMQWTYPRARSTFPI